MDCVKTPKVFQQKWTRDGFRNIYEIIISIFKEYINERCCESKRFFGSILLLLLLPNRKVKTIKKSCLKFNKSTYLKNNIYEAYFKFYILVYENIQRIG